MLLRRYRHHRSPLWPRLGLLGAMALTLGATGVRALPAAVASGGPGSGPVVPVAAGLPRHPAPAPTQRTAVVKPGVPGALVDRSGIDLPRSISIPAIGAGSMLVPLGLNPDGTLEVPTDYSEAGWYTGGPFPGDPGPAVIAGHVSSVSGPGVFFRLRDLKPGDLIKVTRGDGSVAKFVVRSVEMFAKNAFPTERVYGDVSGPALRLITCGGTFNYVTHHYDDNVVVFATKA